MKNWTSSRTPKNSTRPKRSKSWTSSREDAEEPADAGTADEFIGEIDVDDDVVELVREEEWLAEPEPAEADSQAPVAASDTDSSNDDDWFRIGATILELEDDADELAAAEGFEPPADVSRPDVVASAGRA